MRRGTVALLAPLAVLLLSVPGRPAERGASALDQALRDLATDVRAVCLAAHPDDEDAETLALLRRRHGVATTVVVFTRGEGGQNEIGPALGRELGALRTRETRAAAEVIGADVRFLDLEDFGYSRSAEETFEKWGKEEALRRTVRALREIRPQLVITNHDVEGGHGHHQAVGILAREAFLAAADPARFPGQGEPWAVSKLFVACGREEATALPDTGAVDLVRGLSFAEMGLRSLRKHRSQGTWDWVEIGAGPRTRPYRLVLSRLEGGGESLLAGLPPARPEWLTEERRSGTRAEILDRILALARRPEPERPPREKIDRALAACLGLTLELGLEEEEFVPGERIACRVTLRNGGARTCAPGPVAWAWSGGEEGGSRPLPARLGPGEAFSFVARPAVPADRPPDAPPAEHLHDRTGRETALEVTVPVEIPGAGSRLRLKERIRVPVYPPIRVELSRWGRFLRPTDVERRLKITLTNHSPEPLEDELRLSIEGTDRIRVGRPGRVAVPPGETVTVPVTLSPLEGLREGLYDLRAAFGERAEATERVRVLAVGIPGELRVGVVTTYGEVELEALRAMGIEPRALTDEDLEIGDLSAYDAILLGIRAYLARPILRRVNRRLLDYVREGGNLVVNYNKSREWSPSFAPFRIEVGRDRVTVEEAPIDFADPENRLLHFPNEVKPEDFDGWVQERGLYFPSDFDRGSCRVVLRTADPGRPRIPALLVGEVGRGTYVYTCLVWYRELRILNPAALKMLANLVTLNWKR